ncbi:MAG: phosphatase PAP2 family protein [Weeksellaceae bacterium]
MFLNLLIIDKTLSNLLAYLIPHNEITNRIFAFLSLQGLDFFVWVVIFGGLLIWKERQHKNIIFSFLITFAVTFLVVNVIVKPIVRRERPWIAQKLSITYCPKDFSFPSGHAAGAFAGAVIFAHFDRKRRFGYYLLAILISYSRVYLQCHYLGDVIVGAFTGATISWVYIRHYTQRIKL